MEKVFYTDGACSGNPGEGGWACVELTITDNELKTNIISGKKEMTTNSEMELIAVYKALVKSYKEGAKRVTIYSDSAYIVNAIKLGWLINWNKNGWRTKQDKEIKHKEVWQKMYKLVYEKDMSVKILKVKGHSGEPLNELADREAVKAREAVKE